MTAQAPDVLRIDGRTYALYSNPLTPFLDAHPGRLPERPTSTALWRGYIAEWTVRDGRLLLHDVKVPTEDASDYESAMAALFADDQPQPAAWYTGNLIVPTGEMVAYVHMGYGSTYSSYLILTVVEGEVLQRRDLDAEGFQAFRIAQYKRFRQTDDYAEARRPLVSENEPEARVERFLFEYLSETYLSRIFE